MQRKLLCDVQISLIFHYAKFILKKTTHVELLQYQKKKDTLKHCANLTVFSVVRWYHFNFI